jgi:transposase-like protein
MRKRLSKSDLAKIAEMLASGKSTSEVANYLNVSQATIYNQKSKLIRDGLKLPEAKRGRKPRKPNSIDSVPPSQQIVRSGKSLDEYRFLINNVSVRISGKAKDVYVSKDEMRIIY